MRHARFSIMRALNFQQFWLDTKKPRAFTPQTGGWIIHGSFNDRSDWKFTISLYAMYISSLMVGAFFRCRTFFFLSSRRSRLRESVTFVPLLAIVPFPIVRFPLKSRSDGLRRTTLLTRKSRPRTTGDEYACPPPLPHPPSGKVESRDSKCKWAGTE